MRRINVDPVLGDGVHPPAENAAARENKRVLAVTVDDTGEFAILVRSDLKGHGLGWLLMQQMIDYARSEGLKIIEGQVLRENVRMLTMCRELGFGINTDPNDRDICVVKLALAT